jgi:LDH2 family malate/lactate/ureidoglycolate dehydrogenase
LPYYLDMLDSGRLQRAPAVTSERKASSVVHVDAGDGLGHAPSFLAVDLACDAAAETGAAAATVANSSHHGATGCYTRAAALRGFAAIGVTHAESLVAPHGGADPFFGTNPISFALPVPGEDPLLLDMATSSIPSNRVMLRQAMGLPLPPEVALDSKGAFTTDPAQVAALVPLGGAAFGYKGAGLAAMADLLCSAFTGMGHGRTLVAYHGPDTRSPARLGHMFIVLAPAMFQAAAAFDSRVSAFLTDLRDQRPSGAEPVRAPGDLEKAEAAVRARDGVPVDQTTWDALMAQAARRGVAPPPRG